MQIGFQKLHKRNCISEPS